MIGTRFQWTALKAAGLLGLAALVVGCETIGADLNDFAQGLVPKSPGEAARMAADVTDPDRRREGIVLLSNAPFGGSEPYVALYREYAEYDTDPIVRAVAVRALARHGAPEDAAIVASNLGHENVQVRWEAAKGLQRLHDPEIVEIMLERLILEEEELIRAALARALGQYPEDRVFQGLLMALDARELSVNVAARYSLRTLTGQDFGLDAPAWLAWYNVETKAGDPFAGQEEFLYPTYQRNLSFMERVTFWNTKTFEHPGQPAGIRPEGERSTYQDDDTEESESSPGE